MPFRFLLQNHAFGPKDIDLMAKAYEEACQAAGVVAAKDDPRAVIIARKIINAAQRGERDPARLREQAFAALETRGVRALETSLDA